MDIRSTFQSETLMGIFPTAWAASVWRKTPLERQMWPVDRNGKDQWNNSFAQNTESDQKPGEGSTWPQWSDLFWITKTQMKHWCRTSDLSLMKGVNNNWCCHGYQFLSWTAWLRSHCWQSSLTPERCQDGWRPPTAENTHTHSFLNIFWEHTWFMYV